MDADNQCTKHSQKQKWSALCKSVKKNEVAGKREMRVQFKLVDPYPEEGMAYDY